eukprot:TRINITY_DN54440_c0_g1_i2.p1 TRINITY_DN54440_c0_g1~~TRINITY_DN54440_c0_g1_i2.p1  ORF type:complete len:147 (+),score=26.02 TRINITY_DN54440_c0_g1_i2:79-519(+)
MGKWGQRIPVNCSCTTDKYATNTCAGKPASTAVSPNNCWHTYSETGERLSYNFQNNCTEQWFWGGMQKPGSFAPCGAPPGWTFLAPPSCGKTNNSAGATYARASCVLSSSPPPSPPPPTAPTPSSATLSGLGLVYLLVAAIVQIAH